MSQLICPVCETQNDLSFDECSKCNFTLRFAKDESFLEPPSESELEQYRIDLTKAKEEWEKKTKKKAVILKLEDLEQDMFEKNDEYILRVQNLGRVIIGEVTLGAYCADSEKIQLTYTVKKTLLGSYNFIPHVNDMEIFLKIPKNEAKEFYQYSKHYPLQTEIKNIEEISSNKKTIVLDDFWVEGYEVEFTDLIQKKLDEEAEKKRKEEAERQRKEELQRKAKEEAERKRKEVAERQRKEELQRKAKEEAERQRKEEAERQREEEKKERYRKSIIEKEKMKFKQKEKPLNLILFLILTIGIALIYFQAQDVKVTSIAFVGAVTLLISFELIRNIQNKIAVFILAAVVTSGIAYASKVILTKDLIPLKKITLDTGAKK